jgi:hypothetical protein
VINNRCAEGRRQSPTKLQIGKFEIRHWLKLIDGGDVSTLVKYRNDLVQDATELTGIFGAILRKSAKAKSTYEGVHLNDQS